ncbi:MAG: tRNA adenosine(34) deaminase TadA [Hyphomonadaceae bacterium]|jgi:tRNA(adenine34) deaminase|uniref:tRNA adenosine(34) deaminase TadA n=1 Tax=Aquidulcibacter sp. TaxID=2052990 RepID=UPI0022C70945|nr:tRNA adenosine(34) deaminase TadA [Aquidulcibacter sp.]MCE2889759.1 tRNA adenosine(34) deaminase TadA [Hyphomonadaceae bacterium]MCZ8206627.1 tRNA adenosine(34) deaminase TadA [Aquidulcibacter sp.]
MLDDEDQAHDAYWMARALGLAQEAARLGEAPIGAVLVDGETQTLIAEAHNEPITLHDPSGHAEILAIRRAGVALSNYRLAPDLTLYVTLEPCTMCAGAISHARIARLVYGASDAKGGAVEHGVRFYEQKTCHWRPKVTSGILAEPCSEILRNFFRARR